MLIEQIIKFELKGPGSFGRICNPETGYFYDKTKISQENFRMNYYLLLKILQKAMYLASLLLSPISYKVYPKNDRF